MTDTTLEFPWPSHEELSQTFSQSITDTLIGSKIDKTERPFPRELLEVLKEVRPSIPLNTFPDDIPHFLRYMNEVLHATAYSEMIFNLQNFNDFTGTLFADTFITERTFGGWIEVLGQACVRSHWKTQPQSAGSTFTTLSSGPFSRVPTVSTKPSSRTMSGAGSLSKTQFDGTSDAAGQTRIIQVHLRGPTIVDAWRKNKTTVDPILDSTLQDLEDFVPPKWSPLGASAFPVFHGTAAHFKYPAWANDWNEPRNNIQPSATAGQMNPEGVSVIYTGFSPLRCFLWAVFGANMYENIPSGKFTNALSRSWTSQGVTHKGLAVFHYHSAQPKPSSTPELSAFGIPNGKEQEWDRAVKQIISSHKPSESAAWKSLSSIHQSPLPTWPDIIHGMEYGAQRKTLENFSVNMWRTIWKQGQAAEVLNTKYSSTFAISFELEKDAKTETAVSKNQSPSKKDDRKGGKGGGKRDFVRKSLTNIAMKFKSDRGTS